MWEKQYKIYDYLGSLKAVTEEDGTVLTRSYLPFGEPLETELEPQTQDYIGKENDKENNLADHGVRKYDSQIGRFTSTEPLYEKYFGLSPYQYCGNNPVNRLDANGFGWIDDAKQVAKDIIVGLTSPVMEDVLSKDTPSYSISCSIYHQVTNLDGHPLLQNIIVVRK